MGRVTAILAGGQTGVDQAALRAARELGLSIGGWCPPGRACEDGAIPPELPLRETPRERSPRAPDVPRSLRTEWNVRDAAATLVLRPPAAGADAGTDWTVRCARRLGRPLLDCDPFDPQAPRRIEDWMGGLPDGALCVAGPSEGTCPGIGEAVRALLREVLAGVSRPGGGSR